MTKLVVYLLFFGLFTIQTGGHVSSDPAPGRSPGPPITTIAVEDAAGSKEGNSTTLLLAEDNVDDSPSSISRENLKLTKLNDIKRNDVESVSDSDSKGDTTTVGDGGDSDSGSDGAITHLKRVNARSENKSDEGKTHKASTSSAPQSCRKELSEFLSDALVIDDNDDLNPTEQQRTTTNNNNNSSETADDDKQHGNKIDIQLTLEHDMFDVSQGVNCGLLYKVRLATNMPSATTAPTTTTTTTQQSQFLGEFFVETLSSLNGRERGSFVGHSLGNRLPISWFNTFRHNDGGAAAVRDFSTSTSSAEDSLSSDDGYEGFNGAGVENSANTDQQQGINDDEWAHVKDEKHFFDEDPMKVGDKRKKCPDNKWHGRRKNDEETESLNLWILNEFCDHDDTIEFRVFFRTSSDHPSRSNNTVTAAVLSVVYKKTFTFKLVRDCQLVLKELSGSLDYTALPLYSIDCIVHFPSYQLARTGSLASASSLSPSSSSSQSFTPPPGILVELMRLNVPCTGGGYLKFNDRDSLCGKLEELSENERTYHFDVLSNTSVKIFKNPMFSLNYKLVDYCYNVSTSNQSGEFYIRPTMRDSLECFFRIHLPYGNRIVLKLVTNNNSDVILTNSDKFTSGDDVLAIYTSLGLSIETQIVNLSLSGSSSKSSSGSGILSRNNLFINNTLQQLQQQQQQQQKQAPLYPSSISVGSSNGGTTKITNEAETFANFGNGEGYFSNSLATAPRCLGIEITIFENEFSKWSHCVNSSSRISGFILESVGNILSIHLHRPDGSLGTGPAQRGSRAGSENRFTPESNDRWQQQLLPSVYFAYNAKPAPEIVSNCAFGWIAVQQFCVAAIDVAQTWFDGEEHCVSLGGHLASIRTDLHQSIINELLVNSPGYQDHFAYWVGGSDKIFEGDFRWSDGLPFQYTNWFPGWSQHGHYNKQPNDDGLSSQDCIELRRYFRTPPGIQSNRDPLSNNFMWNDRDCNAKNFIICERAMSDESFRRNWINDCNKTVSLTKEHPRASIWSPSFPRQYPDNANCYTTITAPSGYRIVIEFEELVIENEPGCTYDYLEITEPTHSGQRSSGADSKSSKSSRQNSQRNFNNNNNNNNSNSNNNRNNNVMSNNNYDNINTNTNKNNFRKRSSYDNPSLSYTSSTSYVNSNSYNNYNIAQTNYQNLLNIFSNLYKPHTNFLIQTPDYPKGNPFYHFNRKRDDVLPKRLCGDWSSKLKLLRHVSAGSYLGLHFVSDYSHHFGGYKAKAYMENTASECANERLRPYNGSCYLFVSYPEADWWTAQQVCRGMGAKLSSVSSSDEHRFITSNIRNQIDYSPQLVYWLGAELEKSGQFEWTDDTQMNFQGWLPGQGQFDVLPSDATCLGLQWKMSPTPMLPSGLYWQSQKCNKVGGYVCKKPKELYGKFAFSNFTVTGTEGRLISPAYPNSYPLNIDYWVHIKAPERTRIVVQFQKIDLESQDECLYDFVSIQNYELVSKILLEPGTNPVPMAMLTAGGETYDDNNNLLHYDNSNKLMRYARRRSSRSISATEFQSSGDLQQNAVQRGRVATDSHNSTTHDDGDSLMAQFKIQMSYPTKKLSEAVVQLGRTSNSITTKAPQLYSNDDDIGIDDSDDDNNNAGSRNSNEAERQNPKHRRRKKQRQEIENKLQKDFSSYRDIRSVSPPGRRRRRKRSTIVREGIPVPNVDNAQSFLPYVRWCGSHNSNMSKFDFVSSSNEVVLNFRSDYSVTGLGFAAVWKAIDVSGCPVQTLTSREGTVVSPNYPYFMINNLNCAYAIQAPIGRRVWLEFIEYDLLTDSLLEVDIGNGLFRPFRIRDHVNEGVFVSVKEQLRVQFRTGQHPRGRGFQAVYHTVGQTERDRVINLTNNVTGYLFQLNYPHDMPENVDFTQHLVAPFGDNILLELHGVEFSDNGCPDNNIIEIYDNYADNNGTKWQLCKYRNLTSSAAKGQEPNRNSRLQSTPYIESPMASGQQLAPPVYITSYLNTLHIRQKTTSKSDTNLNGTVRIQLDYNYKLKLTSGDKLVESCYPNPCQFNGKCVMNNRTSYCQCQGHYTGRFCGLNLCELEPCVFGKCELTVNNFKCQCQSGYMGKSCEQKQRPCADNPCEGRGICFEKNGGYFCRCHAWWEGHRCERRMLHIPYKPLSERMLQEPFWLGLITVFVVLAVIGLVWCAKRHFPEKIEKLLAEEADRNRPSGSTHGHHHHTSLREQLQFTTAIPQSTGNSAPGAPRSIFNRLGSPSPRKKRNNSTPVKKNAAEKKQILQQLVSPAAAQPKLTKVNLGELIQMTDNRLRVTSGESESDLKETTFSENSASIASTSAANRAMVDPKLEKKVTFARLLNKVSAEMSSGSEIDMGGTRNSSALSLPTDIHFRASSMPPSPCTNDLRSPHSTSSNQGSDSLSSSDLVLTDFGIRSIQANCMISSNNNNNNNNNSINRGAARPKVSSADSILAMFRNFASTTTASNHHHHHHHTTTAAIPSGSSIFVSLSTTPTACSPQDDALGDDESSTSSMHTPVSYSSGAPDSPIFYRQTNTIEVPVLDALSAHKSSTSTSTSSLSASASSSGNSTNLLHPPTILLEIPSNGINNKCLSPIREMPTPMPSPALTPIMSRQQRSNSPLFQETDPLSGGYSDDEDDDDVEDDDDDDEDDYDEDHSSDNQLSANFLLDLQVKRKCSAEAADKMPLDTTTTSVADYNRKPYRQQAAIVPSLEPSPPSAPTLPPSQLKPPLPSITIDIVPPTPEEKTPRPRDLVIPTLTVEQPSPTRNRFPMIIFPGSPPPQRASIGETSFMFPNKQQQKRLLKQFDKPTSLDLPFAPPMITITSNMSEMESDTESLSPSAPKTIGSGGGGGVGNSLLAPGNPVGMCYLSPFTMCSRADRTISESNLSSSGYSSMASPGPSRCGSSNPLCPNEMDEPGSGHSGAGGLSLHVSLLNRRKNSALASCKENITNGKGAGAGGGSNADNLQLRLRARSDSETLSDDILLESNDEGIGTDHVDEKIDDGRVGQIGFKKLQEQQQQQQVLIEVDEPLAVSLAVPCAPSPANQMAQLQLPTIMIQVDSIEKGHSPVSSRSESPLSERAGSMARFSPHFYGRKDQLPFTDSDGLYDFPSSDGKGTSSHYTYQRRSSCKKRERKSSKASATQSPTRNQLDIPSGKESSPNSLTTSNHICSKHCHSSHHHTCPSNAITPRKSPKRRPANRHPIASSSSSSESLASAKELTVRPLPRRLNSPNRDKRPRKQESNSEDEVADALLRRISPSIVSDDPSKPKCKINRLRAIGNQIRFLRRLEKSIKTRERLVSQSDSCPEENTDDLDSPQATSPLLQPQSPTNKSKVALCRQKRTSGANYGISAAELNTSTWKNMERSLIADDDLNSD